MNLDIKKQDGFSIRPHRGPFAAMCPHLTRRERPWLEKCCLLHLEQYESPHFLFMHHVVEHEDLVMDGSYCTLCRQIRRHNRPSHGILV